MFDFLFLENEYCGFCHKEEIYKYNLCEDCLSKLDYVDNSFYIDDFKVFNIYFYNDFMASLIGAYKFHRRTNLYETFGKMVFDYIEKKELFNFDYFLVSPSSKSSVKKRGFDHIKMISDYFIGKTNMTYLEGFKKVKSTKDQHSLSLEDRKLNLIDSFEFSKDLSGKSVLIFDDIITSGNTMKEIAKKLRENSCEEIMALSISSSHKVL